MEKAMAPTPVLVPGKSHGWKSLVAAVHGVAKSRTRLSDFTFTFHFPVLEKEMATHSSTPAWRILGTGEPGELQSMGSLESDMTERLHFHFSLSCTGEGNGNPLQRSCLENQGYRGAWWAVVCGVAQSRTRLKRQQQQVRDMEAWHAAVHGVMKSWTRLGDWTIAGQSTCLWPSAGHKVMNTVSPHQAHSLWHV